MRTPRTRLARPHLTGGMDAGARWRAAPCMDLARSHLWDLDIDGNGRWDRVESPNQRRARHASAKAECRDCPALALCAAEPVQGRQGVIAGRVVP